MLPGRNARRCVHATPRATDGPRTVRAGWHTVYSSIDVKYLTPIFAVSLLVGCASQKQPSTASQIDPAHPPARSASALAFDPPIALNETAPDQSRDVRGQAALIGFEEAQTSTFDVFTYNRQASDRSDYYDQEAVSERIGTTHR